MAQQFFAEVNRQPKNFRNDEGFTVEGTLIQARASQKSFRFEDDSGDDDGMDFSDHQLCNDPGACLHKRHYGKESLAAVLGRALVENCN